jgi:hypothetical protein
MCTTSYRGRSHRTACHAILGTRTRCSDPVTSSLIRSRSTSRSSGQRSCMISTASYKIKKKKVQQIVSDGIDRRGRSLRAYVVGLGSRCVCHILVIVERQDVDGIFHHRRRPYWHRGNLEKRRAHTGHRGWRQRCQWRWRRRGHEWRVVARLPESAASDRGGCS